MRSIELSDMTLRLAEEASGVSLSFREKIELSKLLDKLCLSCIELAPIGQSKVDSLLVKSVAMAVKHAAVAVPVTQEKDSIEVTWAALKGARHPRLQLIAPMSTVQMEYFWHKKPDKMLLAIDEKIRACREKCEDVEFIADDACRSEFDFLCRAVSTAIAAGAGRVTLCDAAGLMFPEEMTQFVQRLRAQVPQLDSVKLGFLCSDTLSLASACAVSAVLAGADEIKTVACVFPFTRLNAIADILKNRGETAGLLCDVRHSEIHRVTAQIEWMCSAGRGELASAGAGTPGEAELSVHDDRAAVMQAIEKIGYVLSEEDHAKVYEAFRSIAEKKETVTLRELDSIVATVALQVPPAYELQHYVINCGQNFSASAHLCLKKDDGEVLEGICLGDGPIDAAFHAIEQIIGHHYELDDFQIQSVTEGRSAMGETIVRLRSNGKVYSGRGISTDIVGASIHAYLNTINKIVYEEAEA